MVAYVSIGGVSTKACIMPILCRSGIEVLRLFILASLRSASIIIAHGRKAFQLCVRSR